MAVAGRYILYGVLPHEHEDNSDFSSEHQQVGHTVPLYGTDDKDEALAVYKAQGFIRNEQWFAVVWGLDTETQMTVGEKPRVEEWSERFPAGAEKDA